jgi:hypothetical protein
MSHMQRHYDRGIQEMLVSALLDATDLWQSSPVVCRLFDDGPL